MRSPGKARTCATAAVTVAALFLPVSAAFADPSSPVEVTVRTDRKELREGGRTSYTITLRNRTSRDYRGLTVAQVVPASFHPSETKPQATVKPTEASWTTDLPAQSSQEFTLRGDVGTVAEQDAGHAARPGKGQGPAGEQAGPEGAGGRAARVSTSVCVQEPVTVENSGPVGAGTESASGNGDGKNTVGRILTCDSAANVLHASVEPRESGGSWPYGFIGTVLLLAGGAGFALHRRSTRVRAPEQVGQLRRSGIS